MRLKTFVFQKRITDTNFLAHCKQLLQLDSPAIIAHKTTQEQKTWALYCLSSRESAPHDIMQTSIEWLSTRSSLQLDSQVNMNTSKYYRGSESIWLPMMANLCRSSSSLTTTWFQAAIWADVTKHTNLLSDQTTWRQQTSGHSKLAFHTCEGWLQNLRWRLAWRAGALSSSIPRKWEGCCCFAKWHWICTHLCHNICLLIAYSYSAFNSWAGSNY